MPRSPHNNPTERILRLLDEMEALSAAYDEQAEALARSLTADAFEKLSPKPRLDAFISEMTRQRLTNRQVVGNRESMQRARLRETAT